MKTGAPFLARTSHEKWGRLTFLNQPCTPPTKKVVSLSLRLRENLGLMPVFQLHLLLKKRYRIFRLEALRYQLPNSRGITLRIERPESREMVRALVVFEFRRRQAVVRGFRFWIVQQGG